MKKSYWVIIFIVIVILIAILLWLAYRAKKENKKVKEMCPDGKTPIPSNGNCPKESIGTNSVPDETGCIQPSSYTIYQYPIKKGMKDGLGGKAVSDLQHKLNIRYNTLLKEDGFWGCNTDSIVREKLGVSEVYTTNPIWNTQEPILG